MKNTGLRIWSVAGEHSKATGSPYWQERDEGIMEGWWMSVASKREG